MTLTHKFRVTFCGGTRISVVTFLFSSFTLPPPSLQTISTKMAFITKSESVDIDSSNGNGIDMQYMQKYGHKIVVIYLPFFLFHCRKKSGERGSETWPTEERRVSVKQSSKEPSCNTLSLLPYSDCALSFVS